MSKPTRLGQQEVVLSLFGYRLCDKAAKEGLERKAQRIAMLSTQPVYILREVGASILTTPIEETLAALREALDAKFESVNQHISSGRNRDIKKCSGLIANVVIYYNTALLSRIYAQKKSAGDVAAIDILKHISPIAWQHINLFGSFEFTQTESHIDLDALAERYNDPDFWSRVLREGVLDRQVY